MDPTMDPQQMQRMIELLRSGNPMGATGMGSPMGSPMGAPVGTPPPLPQMAQVPPPQQPLPPQMPSMPQGPMMDPGNDSRSAWHQQIRDWRAARPEDRAGAEAWRAARPDRPQWGSMRGLGPQMPQFGYRRQP